MKKEFKFVDLDKTILPKAKGKNQDGFRFYNIDGSNYPSITSVLGVKKKKELANWRQSIGEDVANYEMRRAAARGKATHNLIEQYIKSSKSTNANLKISLSILGNLFNRQPSLTLSRLLSI